MITNPDRTWFNSLSPIPLLANLKSCRTYSCNRILDLWYQITNTYLWISQWLNIHRYMALSLKCYKFPYHDKKIKIKKKIKKPWGHQSTSDYFLCCLSTPKKSVVDYKAESKPLISQLIWIGNLSLSNGGIQLRLLAARNSNKHKVQQCNIHKHTTKTFLYKLSVCKSTSAKHSGGCIVWLVGAWAPTAFSNNSVLPLKCKGCDNLYPKTIQIP